MARPPALGIGADGDPRHGHDRRRRPPRSCSRCTIETSSRSSISASNASSAGSACRSSARSASDRPAQSGWLGGERDPDPGPARIGRHVLPARDPARHLRADAVADIRVAERARRTPPRRGPAAPAAGSWPGVVAAARVRVLVRGDIEPLGAGGLQPCDGLAGPSPDGARAALEVRDLEPGAFARRADRVDDSSSDANRSSHSLRMCVAYSPPCRAEAVTSASTSCAVRVHPGRVDQPARQADRAGVHRRLDLADHRAPAPARWAVRGSAPRTDARTVPCPTRNATFGPESLLLDALEVLPERPPARDESVRPQRRARRARGRHR